MGLGACTNRRVGCCLSGGRGWAEALCNADFARFSDEGRSVMMTHRGKGTMRACEPDEMQVNVVRHGFSCTDVCRARNFE